MVFFLMLTMFCFMLLCFLHRGYEADIFNIDIWGRHLAHLVERAPHVQGSQSLPQ